MSVHVHVHVHVPIVIARLTILVLSVGCYSYMCGVLIKFRLLMETSILLLLFYNTLQETLKHNEEKLETLKSKLEQLQQTAAQIDAADA